MRRGVYRNSEGNRMIHVHGAAVRWEDRPTDSVILISDGVWPPGGLYWFLPTLEFDQQGWVFVCPLSEALDGVMSVPKESL